MPTGYMKFSEFKRQYSIKDCVNTFYGGKINKVSNGVMISCPLHSDSNPSCLVGDTNWKCFACGKYGDIYDLLCPLFDKKPSQLVSFILSNGSRIEVTDSDKSSPPKRKGAISENTISIAHKSLLNTSGKIDYLLRRGLSREIIEKSKIGYMSYPTSRARMPRYVIPIYDIDGKLVSAAYRRDDSLDRETEKYLYHPGCSPMLYNTESLKSNKVVALVGGQFDAMVLIQHGVPAIGAAGENTFFPIWSELFKDKIVIILYDNDEAGRIGAEKVHKMLPNNSAVAEWEDGLPRKYDVSDAYFERGIDWIKDILNQRYKSFMMELSNTH